MQKKDKKWKKKIKGKRFGIFVFSYFRIFIYSYIYIFVYLYLCIFILSYFHIFIHVLLSEDVNRQKSMGTRKNDRNFHTFVFSYFCILIYSYLNTFVFSYFRI